MSRPSSRQRQIEESLRQFLLRETEWRGPARKLKAEFDLIANGVIDSMGIHRVISFIESEFGVVIDDHELELENFETVRRIGRLVDSKLAA
jgi:acyl carrier protein